jgi:ParB-like chromosome segregation protein Spo0J
VPLDRLKPHPSNPRRGDVEAIAESLRVNGQYRPIVVRKSDGVILAGNHTAAAAKRLGWESVSAVLVDADEATSLRILLADNRTADLAF